MAEELNCIRGERDKEHQRVTRMSNSAASTSRDNCGSTSGSSTPAVVAAVGGICRDELMGFRGGGGGETRQKRKSPTIVSETPTPRATTRPSRRRIRRQEEFDVSRLPTPPPDPIPEENVFDEAFARHRNRLEAETLRKEGEFLDYLMRLPTPNEIHHQPTQLLRSASAFAASLEAEDAFDHLDRLYTLMEQVLALREQNSKLTRRVRELEHLRALTDAHQAAERAINTSKDSSIPEEDTTMAESLLSAMLSADYDPVQKRILKPPVPRQRSRSVGIEGTTSLLNEIPLYRQISSKRRSSGTQVTPKVSKWTKVKAAFKWERAYTGGINDSDLTRYLKVPENVSQEGSALSTPIPTTPTPPTPGTLSSASSIEDVDGFGRGTGSKNCIAAGTSNAKDDQRDDIENDTTNRQSRFFAEERSSSGHNPNFAHISKLESGGRPTMTSSPSNCPTPSPKCSRVSPTTTNDRNQCSDLAVRRLNPALTITVTVPSNEELRGVFPSPESVSPSRSSESFKSNQDSCFTIPPNRHTQTDTEISQDTSSSSHEGIKRQLSSKEETYRCSPQMQRHNSKWYKVKKAFLAGSMSVPPSPSKTTSFFNDMEGLENNDHASFEDLENKAITGGNIQAEIQRNYHILHKKLSVEFYTKYAEWEKLKAATQTMDGVNQETNSPSPVTSKLRDAMRLQLLGEDQLSPDFRKKLDEWKRIKKGYQQNSSDHQTSRRRFTDWQLWRSPSKTDTKLDNTEHGKPHLSEDFIKKMEEWRRIRSGNLEDEQDNRNIKNSSSSRITDQRKSTCTSDFRQYKLYKPLDFTAGLNCHEKEANKLDREQQKIERQREKFIDREARLSKLRRVVGSSPQKKEVLVQTATGFFRFEGISRKFTRKLYEWEKSQGISAESSTFRLLNSGSRFHANILSTNTSNERGLRCTLKRSRSVGSMVEECTKNDTPIRQPSSLSLNDMEELEAKSDSQISSEPMIADIAEEMAGALDDYEPEAIIVDIEDVIEETASPLTDVQPHQTPIYSVATSETTSIAVPLGTVTANHQPSPVFLVEAGESCPISAKLTTVDIESDKIKIKDEKIESLSTEINKSSCRKKIGQLTNRGKPTRIEGEQSIETRRDGGGSDDPRFTDLLKDESKDIEEKSASTYCRADMTKTSDGSKKSEREARLPDGLRSTNKTQLRLQEKHKSDIAASESPIREKKKYTINPDIQCQRNDERGNDAIKETSSSVEKSKIVNDAVILNKSMKYGSNNFTDLVKEDSITCQASNPRKIAHVASLKIQPDKKWNMLSNEKEKIATIRDKAEPSTASELKIVRSSDSSKESIKIPEPSKLTFGDNLNVERIVINENTLNKIVVRTAVNESRNENLQLTNNTTFPNFDCTGQDLSGKKEKIGSRNVFVKTTRMIFSPFRRESKGKISSEGISSENSDSPSSQNEIKNPDITGWIPSSREVDNVIHENKNKSKNGSPLSWRKKTENSGGGGGDSCKRPPLPQSPILSRKEYNKNPITTTTTKDASSSSIRMMIQRYNQKLDESGSPASSGSASPIWRSPSSERRVRSRTEKYLMEARKTVSSPFNNEILKSASTGLIKDNQNKTLITNTTDTDTNSFSKKISGVLKSPSADSVNVKNSEKPHPVLHARQYSAGSSEPRKLLDVNEPRCGGKLSPALIHKLTTLSLAAAIKEGSVGKFCPDSASSQSSVVSRDQSASNFCKLSENNKSLQNLSNVDESSNYLSSDKYNLPQSKLRAIKIQEAKENFLSFGPGYSRNSRTNYTPSNITSDEIINKNCKDTPIRLDLIKSASAGMINVDVDTFERLSMDRGCESLPRSASKKKSGEITNRFTNIASKFRRARMRRGKDKEGKMSTVSMLCRQSLLVDIQSDDITKSCPSTPAPQRDDDDSTSWTSRN